MVQHGNGSAVYRRIRAANDMAKETEDGAGKNITDITDNIKEIFFQGDISQDTLDEIMGDNIRKDNEALLVCLGEKLKKSGTHQVLPVLGAGISVPAGIPTWDRLLDNMWYRQMVIDLAGSPFPDDALRNRLASANTE